MFMKVIRGVQDQLSHHKDLIPLVGSYVGAAALSVSAILYTSLKKEDVVYNRWWNPMPSVHIDPTKHQQKLIVAKAGKEVYFRDSPVENLRKEIYHDRTYLEHPMHDHH